MLSADDEQYPECNELIKFSFQYDLYDDYTDQLQKFIQTTGAKIIKVWIYFFYPVYIISHSETIKQVLKHSCTKSPSSSNGLFCPRVLISNSLLTLSGGKQWKRRRRLLSAAFSPDQIKNYMDSFNECSEELMIRLSKEKRHTSVEVSRPVSVAIQDILLRCAFSYDGNVQEQGFNHFYVQAVHRLAILHRQRMRNPLLTNDFIYNRTLRGKQFLSLCNFIHSFTDKMINEKMQLLMKPGEGTRQHTAKQPDYLEVLLTVIDDHNHQLSYMEIREEVEAFLFKGHHCLSSILNWALYCLAKHPDVQAKVYIEVCTVIGDEEVEWSHLLELEYLSSFVHEVLRVYTVVPFVDCVIDKPLDVDGVRLEPGTWVQFNIHASQNNDSWENYKEFHPERFTACSDVNMLGYFPFSFGQRNCLGQDFTMILVKVILSRILQTFKLDLDTSHKVTPSYFLGNQPKNGIQVFIHSR